MPQSFLVVVVCWNRLAGGMDSYGSRTGPRVKSCLQEVFGGATTIGTQIEDGGIEEIVFNGGAGGIASGTIVDSGGTLELLGGGATASGTKVSGGTELVFSGGIASGTIVSSGGTEVVFAGGTAVSTTINSGGLEVVSSGGTASGTIVSGAGAELVFSGGTAFGARRTSGTRSAAAAR
jgi:fibronectin-binding autotransporter adhesin